LELKTGQLYRGKLLEGTYVCFVWSMATHSWGL
jgi:hypothetical protein